MTGQRLGYVPSDLGRDCELLKKGLCLEVEKLKEYANPPHLYVVVLTVLIPMDQGKMDERSLS